MQKQTQPPAADAPAKRHPGNRRFWRAWRTAALAYGALVLAVWLLQDQLLFFPERQIVRTPQAYHLAFDDVRLVPDPQRPQEQVRGWFLPYAPAIDGAAAAAHPVILFCHGNARNIASLFARMQAARALGADLLLFDYRGYGASDGKPSEETMYADVRAAWDYLTSVRRIPPAQIVIYGHSLGGGVASWLAAQPGVTPRALILEATFTSVPDLAQEKFWFLPARWICSYRYDNRAHLRNVRVPLLVVHSPADELIPFAHGKAVYAAAPGAKRFLEIAGSHDAGYAESGGVYLDGVTQFLRDVPPGN